MTTTALKKEIYNAIDNSKDNEILEAVYTILKRTIIGEEVIALIASRKKN